MLVVDDALLLGLLAGVAGDEVVRDAVDRGEMFTTGSWFWRLARALHDSASSGALFRAVGELTPEQQSKVLAAIDHLPPAIGLLGLRGLVPVMAKLQTSRPLNLLTAEALAAALVLDATVVVTTRSSLLEESAAQLGVPVRHVS